MEKIFFNPAPAIFAFFLLSTPIQCAWTQTDTSVNSHTVSQSSTTLNASSKSDFPLQQWEIASPLDFETTLSGNFAEMRKNHFHGGLDLRTNGEENKPVYAIDDGYVSRISISRTGYGKCAFITHTNGYVSVYGHLNGFVPSLDSILQAKQYAEKKYEITLTLSPDQFPVKKGQQFAISGNTGASGGPHVHFEIRNSEEGTMRCPLSLKNRPFGFIDQKRPKISGVKIYGLDWKGTVNNQTETTCKIVTNKNGVRKVQTGNGVFAWGKIGFAVKANDYMTATGFSYTPRHLRLFVDNKLISNLTIDSFEYTNTRACNGFTDYAQWFRTREFYMKSYREKNAPILFIPQQPYGTVNIAEERNYNITYEVEDDFGNKDRISFTLTGKRTEIPADTVKDDERIKCGVASMFNRGNFAMKFNENALYTDMVHNFKVDTSSSKFYSPIYSIGSESTPLHSLCDISIKIMNDTLMDKSKYYVAKLNHQNIASGSAGGVYVNGIIVGKTNTLGRFAVFADQTKPVIAPVHTNQLHNLPYIRMKIYDTQSGIDSYDGYVDGEWVLFEYDAKTQQVTYWLDAKHVKMNQNHTFKMIVRDACGNTAEYSKQIFW